MRGCDKSPARPRTRPARARLASLALYRLTLPSLALPSCAPRRRTTPRSHPHLPRPPASAVAPSVGSPGPSNGGVASGPYQLAGVDGMCGVARGLPELKTELVSRLISQARSNLRLSVGHDASALAQSLRRTAFELSK